MDNGMKITGIVAEYNPFHNGHKYMLEKCRENGATHVAAVMSGNFVQRGSVAIMDKRSRAAAAIAEGVDLVIELPAFRAVSSAESFARGAIYLLQSLGCVDALSFGSECEDAALLCEAAEAVCTIKVHELIKEELQGGISYPKARENAVRHFFGDRVAEVIAQPNDILAVEYLKALRAFDSKMKPEPVLRVGSPHDSLKENGEFASASALRILLERGNTEAYKYMPESSVKEFEKLKAVGRAPARFDESERAILSRLRMLTPEDIRNAPDVSEGLENRIYNAILSATSLEELYDIIKTKRYTHSRIRRIIAALYLGITKDDMMLKPPYIRVLGFNARGRELLKIIRETARLPVVMKASQIQELGYEARHVFEIERRVTNLYNLSTPRILPCGTELSDEIVML